jgi:putative transposase
MQEARDGLSAYFRFYNHERPHQSLNNRTPAEEHGTAVQWLQAA